MHPAVIYESGRIEHILVHLNGYNLTHKKVMGIQ